MTKPKTTILIGLIALALIATGILFYARKTPSETAKNKPAKEETKESLPPGMKLYAHDDPKFSVQYPEQFKVTSFEEGDGEKIIFDGAENGKWFQVFVSPYDEPGPVTPERIKKDLPDLVIDNPQAVSIAGEQALVFFGKDEAIGKTREAWIAHDDYLYQVVAPAAFDEPLARIMITWKFQ